MSLDLDPTEQRLAAALDRLAAAHVPDTGEPAAPPTRPDHRRWLALAVAASLIALVAGIWAVAGRDADTSVATVPPRPQPTAPDTATPDTATPDATQPAPTVPPTSTTEPLAPVSDDALAIIDPAVAPGELRTEGVIDRHLRWADVYELQTARAVRRGVGGRVGATVNAWLQADLPGVPVPITIAGRPALRAEGESFGTVTYFVDLAGGTLGVSTQPEVEDEVVAWVEALLADPNTDEPDLTAAAPPDGFEPLPPLSSTRIATYVDGAARVSLETMRFAGPITASDWVATQTYGAAIETDGALTTVTMDGGAGYVLWQPRPDVIVSLTGDGDPGPWIDALRLSSMGEALPAPISYGVSIRSQPDGIDERTVDRIVLGETSLGRFAYVEQSGTADGVCTGWTHEQFGGTGSCTAPEPDGTTVPGTAVARARSAWCGESWAIEHGSYVHAIVIDRADANIEFRLDGAPVTPTQVESGRAADGTAFTAAWLGDPGATADDQWQGTIAVDGLPC